MRMLIRIISLLIVLPTLSCNGDEEIILPIGISENIPTFFYLKYSETNLLENSPEVARYYNTLLEYAGKADTIAAEFYRVEEFNESCQFQLGFRDLDDKEYKYCFPGTPGVHVVLFANGNVGMIYFEPYEWRLKEH